jgi:hypothetical protein
MTSLPWIKPPPTPLRAVQNPPWSTGTSSSRIQGEYRYMVIGRYFSNAARLLNSRAWNIAAACEKASPARYSYVAEMRTGSEYG